MASGKVSAVQTRFPPEPNGYLHIGHAKSMCINFGISEKYGGKCNLFFDDTNPSKEKTEYVDAIRKDIAWLGFTYAKEVYASDFFEEIYRYAEQLIEMGKAYVCDYAAEEISATRGTLTEPGKGSPWRNRNREENLSLFARCAPARSATEKSALRAKIDMASPNINLRDPVIYRILRQTHHRTGDAWCIYPMYDYAHPVCDYLQGVTHSVCTLEFEDHRPLIRLGGRSPSGFSTRSPARSSLREAPTITNLGDDQALPQKAGGRRRTCTAGTIPACPRSPGLRNRGVPPEALHGFLRADRRSRKPIPEVQLADREAARRATYLNQHAERAMAVLSSR